jgi:hypothetical protein
MDATKWCVSDGWFFVVVAMSYGYGWIVVNRSEQGWLLMQIDECNELLIDESKVGC